MPRGNLENISERRTEEKLVGGVCVCVGVRIVVQKQKVWRKLGNKICKAPINNIAFKIKKYNIIF